MGGHPRRVNQRVAAFCSGESVSGAGPGAVSPSLFTPVVALGLSAFVAVVGVVLVLLGWSQLRLSGGEV